MTNISNLYLLNLQKVSRFNGIWDTKNYPTLQLMLLNSLLYYSYCGYNFLALSADVLPCFFTIIFLHNSSDVARVKNTSKMFEKAVQ
jgi:hypothetical protein